ncbi:MAG TPA: phage holin family protein [Chondromyces sp.]|nr:phage holin family protein [Chondromyces sp.]
MSGSGERGVIELVKELRDGLVRLLRLELRLARAELEESAAATARSAVLLAAAGVVALGAWFCLLAAAAAGLHALFTAVGLRPLASLAAAFVTMALVTASAAALLLARGRARLQRARLAPRRAIESVRDVVTPGQAENADG